MAKELGPDGIRVNAVAPGAINITDAPRSAQLTDLVVDLTALGRIGEPDDIAPVVRFFGQRRRRTYHGRGPDRLRRISPVTGRYPRRAAKNSFNMASAWAPAIPS